MRYTNDESHHLLPLTSILNQVKQDPRTGHPRHICPLQEVVDASENVQARPWARHEGLIRHANEVLERLDHEDSARGGYPLSFLRTCRKTIAKRQRKQFWGR